MRNLSSILSILVLCSAIACGAADCAVFCESYAAELAAYVTESGRDMESAGTDYFLSRNGHGAGFFDRGNGPVFRDLQQAARLDGTADTYVMRGWIHFEGRPARTAGESTTARRDASTR